MSTSLTLDYGKTRHLNVAVTDENDAPADISGSEFWWTAKADWLDEATVFAKEVGSGITITDGPGGLAQVTIDAADWADLPNEPSLYVWELVERDADGGVWRLDRGDIYAVPAVLVPA